VYWNYSKVSRARNGRLHFSQQFDWTIDVITIRAAIWRLISATERGASKAADARWNSGQLQRDTMFTERSRDNRLAHQVRADKAK